jgi:hypothetical protein
MYELRQTTILECEIEVLREKIIKLNQEIKELKQKVCEKEQQKTAN